MTRWLLRAAAVTTGWAGAASAQPLSPAALANTRTTPAPAVRAAAPEEPAEVLLMRTAGQPDRRLKVLKRSTFPDGEALVDVQEVTTGQRFTLPAKVADRLPRAGATPPVAAVAPQTPARDYPPPPVPRPTRTSPPVPRVTGAVPSTPAPAAWAPPPAYVPHPRPSPVQPARATLPVAATPTPVPEVEWKAIAPAPVAARPVSALPVATPATPILTPVPSAALQPVAGPSPPLTPLPAPVGPADRWKPIRSLPSKSPAEGGLVIRGQMPASLGGRPTAFHRATEFVPPERPPTDAFGTLPPLDPRPVLAPLPPPAARLFPTIPAVSVSRAPAVELPPLPRKEVVAELRPVPLPVVAPPPAAPGYARLTVPSPVESRPSPTVVDPRPASWRRTRPTVVEERAAAEENLRQVVLRELRPLEDEMATALRPSVRVTAARNLADTRYAARPEVKAVLARSAMTDPSPAVRAACVRALAYLGYADTEYVTYLQVTAGGDAPDALRLAAADSLRRLRPR